LTNAQLCLAAGIPMTAVVSCLVTSLFHADGIREGMREIRGDVRLITAKLVGIDTHLNIIVGRRTGAVSNLNQAG